MSKKIFKEKQHFTGYEVIVTLGVLMIACIWQFLKEINSTAYQTEKLVVLIGFTLFFGGVIYFLMRLKLKVSVTKDNVEYKMYPHLGGKHKIAIDDIRDAIVVKSPVASKWCGGNISFGSERFISLIGRRGIKITTKDGHDYFVGARKVDEFESALKAVL